MADTMFKILKTDLDYGYTKEQLFKGKDPQTKENIYLSYPELTAQLILVGFVSNHPEMDSKQARMYRMLRQNFGEEIKEYAEMVQFSANDFNTLYDEMHNCAKWSSFHAFAVPVLLDELSNIKNATDEEDQAALVAYNSSLPTVEVKEEVVS